MTPRDGIAMWRVAEGRQKRFGGPYAFAALAKRLHATSTVLVADEHVVAYLLAKRVGESLHVVDFEALPEHFTEAVLSQLVAVARASSAASCVALPASLRARLDVTPTPPLHKTRPSTPPALVAAGVI